jgi:hypothetical protein
VLRAPVVELAVALGGRCGGVAAPSIKEARSGLSALSRLIHLLVFKLKQRFGHEVAHHGGRTVRIHFSIPPDSFDVSVFAACLKQGGPKGTMPAPTRAPVLWPFFSFYTHRRTEQPHDDDNSTVISATPAPPLASLRKRPPLAKKDIHKDFHLVLCGEWLVPVYVRRRKADDG